MPKGDKLKLKADPDDGTTPISNLLLEAVAIADLNGTEKGIILYLWRQTYGWVKEGHRLQEATLGQETLAAAFSSSPRSIYASLKSLAEKKVILRKDLGPGKGYIYRMNTNVAQWNSHSIDLEVLKKIAGLEVPIKGSQFVLPSTETSTLPSTETSTLPSTETSTLPSTETSTPFDTNSGVLNKDKEILNKDKETTTSGLAEKLKSLILKNNPKAKTPGDLTKWAEEFRLMLEVDKRSEEDIHKVLVFSQTDAFWKTNILSAGKLREKFDQLYMKMQSGGKYGTAGQGTGADKPNPKAILKSGQYTRPEDLD